MNNKILIGLVVLVAGAFAGWYLLGSGNLKGKTFTYPSAAPTAGTSPSGLTTLTPQQPGVPGTGKGGVNTKTTVSYTDNGFSPKTITVTAGTTVTFVNNSASGMWVASDVHPTHTLLPGFDELASAGKGGSYDYTFVKVGTWTYHNHLNPSDKGTVVVTQ